jgi:hypothetical protein
MKHTTRRMIESGIVPTALGAVMGGILAWKGRPQILAWKAGEKQGLRITPELMQALVLTGLLILAVVVFDAWRSDEMERHRHYLATFVAFVGTGLVTLAGGLLQVMGWPELNWGIVFLVLIGLYLVTWWWACYRYG